VTAKVSKSTIAHNAGAFGLIVGNWTRSSNAALLPRCLHRKLPHNPFRRKRQRDLHRQVMAISNRALAMAIRIKSGGSHFWKSCSINLQSPRTKKRAAIWQPFFLNLKAD
jgi:hypothetical protein